MVLRYHLIAAYRGKCHQFMPGFRPCRVRFRDSGGVHRTPETGDKFRRPLHMQAGCFRRLRSPASERRVPRFLESGVLP